MFTVIEYQKQQSRSQFRPRYRVSMLKHAHFQYDDIITLFAKYFQTP